MDNQERTELLHEGLVMAARLERLKGCRHAETQRDDIPHPTTGLQVKRVRCKRCGRLVEGPTMRALTGT